MEKQFFLKTIEKIYEKVPAHPKLIDRLQATKKALMSEWKNHLLKQAKSPAVQNQVLSLTEDRQLKLFGELISDDSEQSIATYARKLLQKLSKNNQTNRRNGVGG